jgi:hypothetical protein
MLSNMIELQVVDVARKFDEMPSLVIERTSRLSGLSHPGTTR